MWEGEKERSGTRAGTRAGRGHLQRSAALRAAVVTSGLPPTSSTRMPFARRTYGPGTTATSGVQSQAQESKRRAGSGPVFDGAVGVTLHHEAARPACEVLLDLAARERHVIAHGQRERVAACRIWKGEQAGGLSGVHGRGGQSGVHGLSSGDGGRHCLLWQLACAHRFEDRRRRRAHRRRRVRRRTRHRVSLRCRCGRPGRLRPCPCGAQ